MTELGVALNNSFWKRGWQGPTLLGSLRGVNAEEAHTVPRPLKHGIWHLALHAAYWKYAVCLRVSKTGVSIDGVPTDHRGVMAFPRSPSNFPEPPATPSARQWKADIELLRVFHIALVDATGRLSSRQLDSIPPGGKSWALRPMIIGAAAHDAYHCGQIQLIKKLIRKQ